MSTQTIMERFNEYANQGDVFCQEILKSFEAENSYSTVKPEEMEDYPFYFLALTLRDDAEQGNADAQYSLGLSFLTNLAREELNPTEGIKWLRLAAMQGHAKAQVALGGMYESSLANAGELDENECLYWLQLAAEQGNMEATGMVGVLTGNMDALTKAAEAGNPSACFNLSVAYSKGSYGTEVHEQKAFHWMLKAAEAGDFMAQRYVAFDYCSGKGIYKSLTQARLWLMKAMEQEFENEKLEM